MRKEYLDMLVTALERAGLDAMLLCPSEELNFFVGFSPLMCERFQALFVLRNGRMFYFCNLLTGDEVRSAAQNAFPVYTWTDNEQMTEVIRQVFESEGLSGTRIAVNSSAQAFQILEIARETNVVFISGVSLLENIRARKTETELENLRRAAEIADRAFIATLPQIRAGMTERELHDILTGEMARLGGAEPGALIASGGNAGYPHYSQDQRVLQPGDCIVMDFGCLYNGLHSDMTRTVFLSPVSERARRLYWLLYRAQLITEQLAVEGAFVPDLDSAARCILAEQDMDRYFTTRVGHGIGYMTHEAPYINAHNRIHLQRGMCFSIEPGIYLPGELGLRIEDIVAINLQGETEILNKATKHLLSVDPDGTIHQELPPAVC